MGEDLMYDFDEKTGKEIKFCRYMLYKTKGRGPISGRILDAKISQDMGGN